MFAKTVTVGEDRSPLYRILGRDGAPRWNFYKYVLGRDGKVRARFSSRVRPEATELRAAIDAALAEPAAP
jgi:glutathione peroxidase